MCEYTNYINLTEALNLGLFDDVPYKYLKKVLDHTINRAEYYFYVDIKDISSNNHSGFVTEFKFTIENCKITKILKYNCVSDIAFAISKLIEEEEEEEEEEEF